MQSTAESYVLSGENEDPMVALRQNAFEKLPERKDAPPSRDEIAAHHLIDEPRLLGGLAERAIFTGDERRRTSEHARHLVEAARVNQGRTTGVDAFMREYGLSSEEGIILMCLAEALLRIPDAETADQFIAEKISGGHWERHLGHSESLFVNASTWGLLLTGRLMRIKETRADNPWEGLKRLVARSGEPVIRQAVRQAVKLLGDQFVLGRTIKEALERSTAYEARGYRFSYDMLGEAAKTAKDAERYFERYMSAIEAVGKSAGALPSVYADALLLRPSLSVKLSALHPRFEPGKEARLNAELLPRLMTVLRAAEAHGLAITIDAEEQDRLEPTLDLFAQAYLDPALARWPGLGLAVQAYGKRAVPVIRWLRRLSERGGKRIPIRLVKGAYWDSEIKWAQERGLSDYPVLTRKLHTDVSYLACMRLILSDAQAFFPQFATHNAHTVSAAIVAAGQTTFEFQRLHGMGEALYDEVLGEAATGRSCRIYAPVGDHEDLLSYLVRRLLENGANTSFVNRLADNEAPISQIIRDPIETLEREHLASATVKLLPRPRDMFWPERKASQGVAITDRTAREALIRDMEQGLASPLDVGPIVAGEPTTGGLNATPINSPHDRRERVGTVRLATPAQVDTAIRSASRAQHDWDRLGGPARARILDLAADMLERDRARFMAVLVREAGKTIPAAMAEVREATDLLRYYAVETRRIMSQALILKGPTGEANTLELRGRGPFACISPWNFPLAIFLGQIAAALASGNTVIAKPAEQTPITAYMATQLLHDAGVPKDVLHLVTGGAAAGAALVKSPLIKGVAFTGSNDVAWSIQKALADRRSEIVPLIAETGGINAMIADSSALTEQIVRDAVRSAFDSAGQRCSAARVLFVQDDVAARTVRMLAGAIETLDIGDPFDYATDIGPVIDETSQDLLEAYKIKMKREAREIIDARAPEACRVGTFVTPACYEIDRLAMPEREVFGPILHVVPYQRGHLDRVVAAINASGFGLTIGLHSRISAVADYVSEHARVGNLYVNRNQIGAVPGVQPFGGDGLSGTGPKAGGPNYLFRFATERTRTTDVTATGGNVTLLTQDLEGT